MTSKEKDQLLIARDQEWYRRLGKIALDIRGDGAAGWKERADAVDEARSIVVNEIEQSPSTEALSSCG